MTLALYVFQNSRSKNTKNNSCCFSGIGAATGLFTACPTCAGTFFLTLVGTIISAAGAPTTLAAAPAAAAAALAPFQILFIIISIAVLLVSAYLTINSIKKNYASNDPIK
jgi:hypothetical protein